MMKVPFRPFDLVTILGIVMLLMGTPPYLAQEPEERAIAAGTTFSTPPVHLGDTIDLELVFQQRGHPATSTGTVLTVHFRAPEDNEGPEGTVLVQELRFPALHVDLGPARVAQNARVESHYLDGAGRPLAAHSMDNHYRSAYAAEHLFPPTAEGAAVRVEGERRSNPWVDLLPAGADANVTYQGRPTWQPIRDLFWAEEREDAIAGDAPAVAGARVPSDEERRRSPFAAMHEGRVLYAKMFTEQWYGPADLREPNATWIRSGYTAGFRTYDIPIEWEDAFVVEGPFQRWQWFARDIPIQGLHEGYVDKQGEPTHSFDLVPTRIVRGEEPVVFVPPERTPAAPAEEHVLPLFSGSAPLVEDVDLDTLRAWLGHEDAPPLVRSLMEDGASFGGLAWRSEAGRLDLVASLVTPQQIQGVKVARTDDGIQIESACDDVPLGRGSLRVACSTTDELYHGPHWRGAAPAEILSRVDELRLHLPPQTNDSVEVGTIRFPVYEGVHDTDGHAHGIMQPLQGWAVGPSDAVDEATATIGVLEQDQYVAAGVTTRQHDVQMEHWDLSPPGAGFGDRLPPATASTVQAPRVIDPLGPEVAGAGALLVLAGLALRMLFGLLGSGGVVALAPLYAKIAKDHVLDSERRETVHDAVQQDPGVTVAEVAERSGLSRTGAFHHLQTLHRNGLVSETRIGRMRHYFPAHAGSPTTRMRTAVSRHRPWDDVLQAIEGKPGCSMQELVHTLDRSKTSVSRAGTRLADLGLVKKERNGRTVLLYPVQRQG